MRFKGLENKYVSLRALELADLDVLYKWENDSNNWVFGNTMAPYSKFTLDEFIKTASYDIFVNKQVRFIIESKKDNAPAGAIDLFDMDFVHRRTGIGILIDAGFRREGLAARTLEIISTYVFGMLNMRQIYCHITSDNKKSIELFEKADFVRSGCLKEWILHSGKWKNVYIYQKLNNS